MAQDSKVKKPCPVTRAEFNSNARPMTITINGTPLIADPREFSTDSFGWYGSGKCTVPVNGVGCKVQCNLSFVVVGSKDAE